MRNIREVPDSGLQFHTTMIRKHFAQITAAVLLLLTASMPGLANNRPPQRLINIYQRAFAKRTSPEGLAIADTLLRLSIAEGCREMEVRALSIPMKYHFVNANEYPEVERAAKPFMDKCQEYGMVDYFYEGVSTKTTWLTNHNMYKEALDYQKEMLEYAKRHNHRSGIILGFISTGNIYRMRMDMARAVAAYTKAMDYTRRYMPGNDLGQSYRRIAECYLIAGHFDRVVATADAGISITKDERRAGGMFGMKAFALFMQNKDSEFLQTYRKYKEYGKDVDIQPIIARCIEVMKLIADGKDAEAAVALKKAQNGGFWLYTNVGYDMRKGNYANALNTLRNLNISLYGESKGSLTTELSKFGAEVRNDMHQMDKERAEYENGLLELVRKKLELKNTDLELNRLKTAENIARTETERKRLSLDKQTMVTRQLSDSLTNQQLKKQERERKEDMREAWLATTVCIVMLFLIIEYAYYRRNKRLTDKLKATHEKLRKSHADVDIANAKAIESDRNKTDFIRNMSHEIRTPLNSIVGFTQVLTDPEYSPTDEEILYMKQSIDDSSASLSSLINDILDLTSMESGKYVMKIQPTPLNDICREALERIKDKAADGTALHFRSDAADDFMVDTDRMRIGQVMDALLSNAAKFTESGFINVDCSLSGNGNSVTISVADSGCGIPADKQDAIFSRFSKLDKFKPGNGLGLFICRTIVTVLGGEIGIDKGYKGGARFWLTVPTRQRISHETPVKTL